MLGLPPLVGPLGCVGIGGLIGGSVDPVPKLVARARTYDKVPYVHRGRSRKGVDCAGLVWCCYADEGILLPDVKRYGREPNRLGLMMQAVRDAFGHPVWEGDSENRVPRALLAVGDVLVLRFVREPHHMAIIGTDRLRGLSLIHAHGESQKVVEHGLDDDWQSRILAVFRRPI